MTVEEIHERNRRVEADKAWETSWTRRLSIAGLTYLFLLFYLPLLGLHQSYLHATVPVCGYLLSTMTLPVIKKRWLEKFYKAGAVLLFALFFSHGVLATEYQCPPKVETAQMAKYTAKGWTASVDTTNDQIFDSITLFDGPPKEMASLAPDNEDERGPMLWTFDEVKPRPIYLQCNYRQTAVRLSLALPDSVTECTYDASRPGLLNCVCDCSK